MRGYQSSRWIGVLFLVLGLVLFAPAVEASGLTPARTETPVLNMPPTQGPTPPPTPPPAGGDPITQIINQIIQFPFENLVEALQNALKSILTGTITPLETFFSASIGRWLTSSPGIVTPGGGIAQGDDVMGPAWRLMVKVAVLLWPLTLAIIAAIAAKDAVAAASWGIGDLKEALGGWLFAVVLSATSLYWMDLVNRFTNATTMTILNMSFVGEAGFQPNALTVLVFGTAGLVLTWVAMPASLIIVIFVILMGLAVLSSLVFQFLARFVILYILVALAPVVIILGVLPPLSWFRYMWLRGFIMVEAIGPINALLLKLVMVLTVRGTSNDPITAFVNFIGAIGVLSILITIDGVIIKGVFGAAEEVMQKAVSTVQSLGTLAIAGVTALAGGAIAGGAVGAAGATSTTAAGGAGASGAGSAAVSAWSAGNSAAAGARAASAASVARGAFSPGAALRGAGDVLFRQPGMVGSFGAAMRSVGGVLEQREQADQAQARWSTHSTEPGGASSGNSKPGGNPRPRNPSPSNAPNSNASANNPTLTPSANGAQLNQNSNASSNPGSGAGSTNNPGSTNSTSINSTNPNPPSGNAQPSSPASRSVLATPVATPGVKPNPVNANSGNGEEAGTPNNVMPPPQIPSVSPMGVPLSLVSMPASAATASAPTPMLSREAENVAAVLPTPLGERASAFASLYPDANQQVAAARAAADAFSQVNAKGQNFYDIGWQGAAWDRSMAPVMASARQGVPLETLAQDAGFGGNVGGFLANRMLDQRQPTLDVPAQAAPWHPQMTPHDWEIGSAVSNALGHQISQGAAARVYHEIRSPESGGGWNAGSQFIQSVQGLAQQPPADVLNALCARLTEMETRGLVSQRAMTLWRANAKTKS
ncbi:hypothetical protein ANRL3_01025 [Anaerolineae bacterium]|nr:hypothetical protein ANRL3_01025 [Anaerolineae bacterium]